MSDDVAPEQVDKAVELFQIVITQMLLPDGDIAQSLDVREADGSHTARSTSTLLGMVRVAEHQIMRKARF